MLKFFRKYNKRILAIVTVLLMIAFLGGTAMSSLLAPSVGGMVIAAAYGEPVTQGDFQQVDYQTRILDELGSRYTLGYVSTNPAADGKFREVEVKLTRSDLRGAKVRTLT